MSALAILLAAQAATAAPAQAAPDISLHATVDARSVKVRAKGEARANVTALPDAGSTVQSSGSESSRHFELWIDARIANALAKTAEETDSAPQR